MIYDTSVLVVKYEQILGLFAIFFHAGFLDAQTHLF